MESKSKLTLENAANGFTSADLEYVFSNGESITMRFLIPKPAHGESSRTVQQIEELMLRKTQEIAQSMLAGLEGKGA